MDLKVGDVVRFKDIEFLNETKYIKNGWNPLMNYLCGQTRIIDESILERIKNKEDSLWEENATNAPNGYTTWYISLDMIELVS